MLDRFLVRVAADAAAKGFGGGGSCLSGLEISCGTGDQAGEMAGETLAEEAADEDCE